MQVFWLKDDPLLFDYNVQERVDDFVAAAISQVSLLKGIWLVYEYVCLLLCFLLLSS